MAATMPKKAKTESRADESERGSHPPRVVMLLANTFQHDTRVLKEAKSLIEWGCDVHVVAMMAPHLPARETRNGMKVHRTTRRPGDLLRLTIALLAWPFPMILRRFSISIEDVAEPIRRARRFGITPVFRWIGRTAHGAAQRSRAMLRSCVGFGDRIILAAAGARVRNAVAARLWIARMRLRRMRYRIRAARKRTQARFRNGRRRALAWAVEVGILPYAPSLRVLAFNLRLAGLAARLRPDVIHAHDLNTLLAGAIVKRLTGCKLVYDSHELFLHRNIGTQTRWMDRLIWGPVERMTIGRCDAVISVAEGICLHLQKQYGIAKPHLIRNVQRYEPPAPRTTLLADELGVPHEKRIVIYPGAITINRGLEVMIDSSPCLDNAVYVIMGYAGNAAYLESLRERAAALGQLGRAVFFRDAVPVDDVSRYVASADLGIVPTQNVCLSYYFESSNKIFHCLSVGVPVAMSDHAEKRMIVEEFGVGVLFEETDPRAIAEAVNRTLADSDSYAAMSENCLRAARELNWEREEEKLRRIYAELLGDQARPVPAPVLPVESGDPLPCLARRPLAAAP